MKELNLMCERCGLTLKLPFLTGAEIEAEKRLKEAMKSHIKNCKFIIKTK